MIPVAPLDPLLVLICSH